MPLPEAGSHETLLLCGEQIGAWTKLRNNELAIGVSEYLWWGLHLDATGGFNRYAGPCNGLPGDKIHDNSTQNRRFPIRDVEEREREYDRSNGLRRA